MPASESGSLRSPSPVDVLPQPDRAIATWLLLASAGVCWWAAFPPLNAWPLVVVAAFALAGLTTRVRKGGAGLAAAELEAAEAEGSAFAAATAAAAKFAAAEVELDAVAVPIRTSPFKGDETALANADLTRSNGAPTQ